MKQLLLGIVIMKSWNQSPVLRKTYLYVRNFSVNDRKYKSRIRSNFHWPEVLVAQVGSSVLSMFGYDLSINNGVQIPWKSSTTHEEESRLYVLDFKILVSISNQREYLLAMIIAS